MKKSVSILFLSFYYLISFSQKADQCYAGIYLTEKDFLSKRLSHKINKDLEGYKFGFAVPADWKLEIKIEKPDTTLRFKPGSVYGYSECGRDFRYSSGGELYAPEDYYRIEEIKGLTIYTSVFIGGDEFFYSTNPTGKIHRLKISNIERDFKNRPEFVEAVKQLNKEAERGNLGKRDENGHFIVNKIYKDKTAK